jgi:predicted DNA-binding transcriptional regulator YafY
MLTINGITEGARYRIVYRDCHNEITERVIDVKRIYRCLTTRNILVLAYCHRRGADRTFNGAGILFKEETQETGIPATFGPDPLRTPDALAWLPLLALPTLQVAYA